MNKENIFHIGRGTMWCCAHIFFACKMTLWKAFKTKMHFLHLFYIFFKQRTESKIWLEFPPKWSLFFLPLWFSGCKNWLNSFNCERKGYRRLQTAAQPSMLHIWLAFGRLKGHSSASSRGIKEAWWANFKWPGEVLLPWRTDGSCCVMALGDSFSNSASLTWKHVAD